MKQKKSPTKKIGDRESGPAQLKAAGLPPAPVGVSESQGDGVQKRVPNAPWWIKAFVAFHIIAVVTYCLPNPPENILTGKVAPRGSDWILLENFRYTKQFPPTRAYCLATGFWQYWDMFAPDPANIDMYLEADVVYKDGHVEKYRYPRMYLLSLSEKYVKERYRKFFERAYLPEKPYVWSRVAQRIALLNDKYPNNPPDVNSLYRYARKVMPPDQPQITNYDVSKYFTYVVDQERLAADEGKHP